MADNSDRLVSLYSEDDSILFCMTYDNNKPY